MRQIWGGLLCLSAGLVVALSGVGSGGDAGAGVLPICGVTVGVAPACPTGTITVSETSVGSATPPATWALTVTSPNCPIVNGSLTVPQGGTATTDPLFIYQFQNSTVTTCSYTLTESPVAGWTPTFDPAGPYTLPAPTRGPSDLAVALTNTSATVTATPTTPTGNPTSPAAPGSSVVATTARATPTAAVLAATGPATTVRWSLWIGVGLCVVGAVMVGAGWRRRGTHTG